MSALTASSLPCTAYDLLHHNAVTNPTLVLVKFDDGTAFTATQLLAAVQQQAIGLQRLGVKQDDYVLSWLPNGPAAVLLLLALNYLGAIYVPINTAYKGRLLQHVLHNVGATLMIADGGLLEHLAAIDVGKLQRVVVMGNQRPAIAGVSLLDSSVLQAEAATLQAPARPIQPWDTQCVIFTSGTTGPSKGVLCSYRHTYTAAVEFKHVGPGDTNLVALPLFHIGGILGLNFALIHGGTAAFVERFRTSTFWSTVQALGVTSVGLLGTMVQFLMQQPPTAQDKQHPVRKAVIAPFGDEALAFAERFGVEVFTEFNMTELSVPLWAGPNPSARGTCGKPRAGVQLKLVDTNDHEVPVGAIGELILRCDEPWTLSHGYLNDPVATAHAWRNQWFHTGDLFYRDANNNYFFVDRLKDMIRRRGENISSFEVEAELLAYPGVKSAAAVGVHGDGGEQDVLAVLAMQEGHTLAYTALFTFLQQRLPHFMLPRYVRVLSELPLTPTQKIEKHVLRTQGVTADTWDREVAGVQVQRAQLNTREPQINTQAAPPANASVTAPTASSFPHKREPTNPLNADPRLREDYEQATPKSNLSPTSHPGPLQGLRVIEFAGLGPAPFCCMLLADLGADVVCIDKPGTTYQAADVEARGRTRVQLNLKDPQQQQQALTLIEHADILIEGFRPGVMERLGLGPDVALQRNPRLVYGRMTGWGQSGPLAHKAGHDLNYLAITGALHALGSKDKPAVPLNLIADFGGGALYLALGVMAALQHAQRTGQGQVVDAAMTDGVLSMMSMIYGDFADGRWTDERESNVIDGAAPFYNVYRCQDDKWLSVAAIETQFYQTLLTQLSALEPELLPTNSVQTWLNQQWDKSLWPAQQQQLASVFMQRPREAWVALLAQFDVCVAPVLSLAEAQQHPHNVQREAFVRQDEVQQPAVSPKLTLTSGRVASVRSNFSSVEDLLNNWQAKGVGELPI